MFERSNKFLVSFFITLFFLSGLNNVNGMIKGVDDFTKEKNNLTEKLKKTNTNLEEATSDLDTLGKMLSGRKKLNIDQTNRYNALKDKKEITRLKQESSNLEKEIKKIDDQLEILAKTSTKIAETSTASIEDGIKQIDLLIKTVTSTPEKIKTSLASKYETIREEIKNFGVDIGKKGKKAENLFNDAQDKIKDFEVELVKNDTYKKVPYGALPHLVTLGDFTDIENFYNDTKKLAEDEGLDENATVEQIEQSKKFSGTRSELLKITAMTAQDFVNTLAKIEELKKSNLKKDQELVLFFEKAINENVKKAYDVLVELNKKNQFEIADIQKYAGNITILSAAQSTPALQKPEYKTLIDELKIKVDKSALKKAMNNAFELELQGIDETTKGEIKGIVSGKSAKEVLEMLKKSLTSGMGGGGATGPVITSMTWSDLIAVCSSKKWDIEELIKDGNLDVTKKSAFSVVLIEFNGLIKKHENDFDKQLNSKHEKLYQPILDDLINNKHVTGKSVPFVISEENKKVIEASLLALYDDYKKGNVKMPQLSWDDLIKDFTKITKFIEGSDWEKIFKNKQLDAGLLVSENLITKDEQMPFEFVIAACNKIVPTNHKLIDTLKDMATNDVETLCGKQLGEIANANIITKMPINWDNNDKKAIGDFFIALCRPLEEEIKKMPALEFKDFIAITEVIHNHISSGKRDDLITKTDIDANKLLTKNLITKDEVDQFELIFDECYGPDAIPDDEAQRLVFAENIQKDDKDTFDKINKVIKKLTENVPVTIKKPVSIDKGEEEKIRQFFIDLAIEQVAWKDIIAFFEKINKYVALAPQHDQSLFFNTNKELVTSIFSAIKGARPIVIKSAGGIFSIIKVLLNNIEYSKLRKLPDTMNLLLKAIAEHPGYITAKDIEVDSSKLADDDYITLESLLANIIADYKLIKYFPKISVTPITSLKQILKMRSAVCSSLSDASKQSSKKGIMSKINEVMLDPAVYTVNAFNSISNPDITLQNMVGKEALYPTSVKALCYGDIGMISDSAMNQALSNLLSMELGEFALYDKKNDCVAALKKIVQKMRAPSEPFVDFLKQLLLEAPKDEHFYFVIKNMKLFYPDDKDLELLIKSYKKGIDSGDQIAFNALCSKLPKDCVDQLTQYMQKVESTLKKESKASGDQKLIDYVTKLIDDAVKNGHDFKTFMTDLASMQFESTVIDKIKNDNPKDAKKQIDDYTKKVQDKFRSVVTICKTPREANSKYDTAIKEFGKMLESVSDKDKINLYKILMPRYFFEQLEKLVSKIKEENNVLSGFEAVNNDLKKLVNDLLSYNGDDKELLIYQSFGETLQEIEHCLNNNDIRGVIGVIVRDMVYSSIPEAFLYPQDFEYLLIEKGDPKDLLKDLITPKIRLQQEDKKSTGNVPPSGDDGNNGPPPPPPSDDDGNGPPPPPSIGDYNNGPPPPPSDDNSNGGNTKSKLKYGLPEEPDASYNTFLNSSEKYLSNIKTCLTVTRIKNLNLQYYKILQKLGFALSWTLIQKVASSMNDYITEGIGLWDNMTPEEVGILAPIDGIVGDLIERLKDVLDKIKYTLGNIDDKDDLKYKYKDFSINFKEFSINNTEIDSKHWENEVDDVITEIDRKIDNLPEDKFADWQKLSISHNKNFKTVIGEIKGYIKKNIDSKIKAPMEKVLEDKRPIRLPQFLIGFDKKKIMKPDFAKVNFILKLEKEAKGGSKVTGNKTKTKVTSFLESAEVLDALKKKNDFKNLVTSKKKELFDTVYDIVLNGTDYKNVTILHWAIWQEAPIDVIKIIVNEKKDFLNAQDSLGNTPLIWLINKLNDYKTFNKSYLEALTTILCTKETCCITNTSGFYPVHVLALQAPMVFSTTIKFDQDKLETYIFIAKALSTALTQAGTDVLDCKINNHNALDIFYKNMANEENKIHSKKKGDKLFDELAKFVLALGAKSDDVRFDLT